MYKQLKNKEATLAVIGLGYVGLPVALAFAKKMRVIGFDVDEPRVQQLNNGEDPTGELPAAAFKNTDITFSADPADLANAQFYVVAVPTPIDEHSVPNLEPIISASELIGDNLEKGDYVVYESTVYPGCTEEDCVPILEEKSGLEYGRDFKVGYSPERINPGDMQHSLEEVVKVVSGCDAEALQTITKIYSDIVEAGIHEAPTIKVAEAAKVIENTQRDVNIALVNELSIIFDKLGINTYDVLEAAATKWNFIKYYPGLVGGHCIGVDPYYLTYKAKELGYNPQMILSGRRINDGMSYHVVRKTVQLISQQKKDITESKVLIMGVTFKANVSDVRNTKVVPMVEELERFNIDVDVVDEWADEQALSEGYGLQLTAEPKGKYDAIIVAVDHDDYKKLNEADFKAMSSENGILIDVKGIYRHRIEDLIYWSL
jgi:UDP-N-acetyl-D-galactosamine dehydrogenase